MSNRKALAAGRKALALPSPSTERLDALKQAGQQLAGADLRSHTAADLLRRVEDAEGNEWLALNPDARYAPEAQ